MKIKPQEQTLFNEIKSKYGLKREGLLSFLLKKSIKKKLDSDPDLHSALKQADKELEKFQNYMGDLEKQGVKLPDWAKQFQKAK
jgi:endonuclease IV